MSATQHFTIREAADLSGWSFDSIKRDRTLGYYPNARRGDGPNAPWLIPLDDLIAAGRYTPEPDQDPGLVVADRRAERDLALLREQLAASTARADRAEGEVAYLRTLLDRRAA